MARLTENDIVGVMLGVVEGLALEQQPVLIAGDPTGRLRAALDDQYPVALWNRRVTAGQPAAQPWPAPPNRCFSAFLRLPNAREELEMTLHAIASVMVPEGRVWIYGANDEGIRSTQKAFATLYSDVTTIDARGHCRVLEGRRPATLPGLKGALDFWRKDVSLDVCGQSLRFACYPGMFAAGRLDTATRLLIGTLSGIASKARVIDYGSGAGVIAAAVRMYQPDARLVLIDNDAVAVEAARQNVPGADVRLAADLSSCGHAAAELILSNPPIHVGKSENHAALHRLIADAPACLAPGGVLRMVVQRRVQVRERIMGAFGNCEAVAEDNAFIVLQARKRR